MYIVVASRGVWLPGTFPVCIPHIPCQPTTPRRPFNGQVYCVPGKYCR